MVNININICYNFFFKKLKKIYYKKEINKLFFILFCKILKCNKEKLYFYILNNKKINFKEYVYFLKVIKKLKYKYPIQYIIKYTYFQGLKINLNKNIFIPRQETEELVYLIKKENKKQKKKINILDICSGSGCISIYLKKKIKNSNIYCIDNKKKIILKSKENFLKNKIYKDVFFLRFNILNNKKKYKNFLKKLPDFDLIVSNPPYISYKKYYKFKKTNILKEPKKSIFVFNKDEIIFYKKILLNFYKKKLKKNGVLYFEISNNIKKKIFFFLKKKIKDKIKIIKDINNNYRILKIEKI
ncbi:MAG: HemK family protein methyltransferase [Candidatus Shikimatogenerans sp. JK-2022]|nr:HemK family protein methyltransferase [Candidatus Shikimatogenerans bostrichidophilus]